MTEGTTTEGRFGQWPPSFPHADIDRLVERLGAGEGDVEDAERLLLTITREAQRLRSSVVRLSAARLTAAEHEAHEIITLAHADAEDVRRRALRALDDRLDESDALVRAMRRSFLVEQRLRGSFTTDGLGNLEVDDDGAGDDDRGPGGEPA